MMIASQGIIIVDRKTANQKPRKRSGRNTNAYAARTLVTSCPSVISPAAATLLPYWRTSGITSSALA